MADSQDRRPADLFSVTWYRDTAGYSLRSGGDRPSRSVSEILMSPQTERAGPTSTVIVRNDGHLEPYSPREFPDLFREFADLPDTPDGALAFVERFGFLGLNLLSAGSHDRLNSEDVDQIIAHSQRVQRALFVVDAGRATKGKLQRQRRRHSEELNDEGDEWQLSRRSFDSWPQTIAELFNELAFPWPDFTARLAPTNGPKGQRGIRLELVPRTLLDFIWLQVAEELQTTDLRRCETCGRLMQTGKGGDFKAGTRVCSTACRQTPEKDRPFAPTRTEQ